MAKAARRKEKAQPQVLRVLYVEDRPADAELALLQLEKGGFKIQADVVDTPEAFQEKLSSEPYDIVLSDYRLPNWTGMDALKMLQGQVKHIPFILVTGTVGDETAVECIKEGVTDYVVKDHLSRLPFTVGRALEERALQDERDRATEALRESEERYRVVAENATDAIITINEESTILFVNVAAEKIFGYTVAEMLGQPLTLLMPERLREAHRAAIKRYVTTGEKHLSWEAIQLPGLHKSGKEILLEVSFGEFVKDRRRMMTGVLRDITERKNLEEQLRQSQKMEAIGQLAGGVAHDFNNLLTIITGYNQLMLDRVGDDDSSRGYVQEIKKAGDRAISLTRQLLAFSRRQMLAPEVLDLNVVLTNVEKMLRRMIGEDISLVLIRQSGLGRVKGDPWQMEQLIVNLAINSRDAMPQGGRLTIETANMEVEEAYARGHVGATPGPHVVLSVSDSGCGMDEKTKARIFEPFFTTKEQGKGTGLGLAMVYGIVKQTGGHIWVYSEPGRGSTFKIYLPRFNQPAEAAACEVSQAKPAQGTETVLLVEDEPALRSLARGVLESNGYTVIDAGSGHEALLVCKRHKGPIHLMLTDVVMPQMSGRELASRLASFFPRMKLLYMSGYTSDSVVQRGVVESGVAFLQKPFTPQTLAQKVREVIDGPTSGNV